MTITIRERPRQKVTLDPKRPTAVREYYAFGSDEKIEIQLAALAAIPLFDSQRDPNTGNLITLFRGTPNIEEAGGGTWNITAPFESSQNTIDLNFSFGVQSVNIKQSLRTVRSYSCLRAVSIGTEGLAAQALTDAAAAVTAYGGADEANVFAYNAELTATTSANVGGVDATVKADVLATVLQAGILTGVTPGLPDGLFAPFLAELQLASSDATSAGNAASLGDAEAADTAATNSEGHVAAAVAALVNIAAAVTAVDNANATTQADYALVAMPNAQTTQAASDCQDLTDAIDALYSACLSAKNAANLAAETAREAADAALADQAPGGNSVPDFNGAIGVNGDTVEGCEIEVAKLEFSITKKWAIGTLSGAYLQLLGEWTDRCRVNNNAFTIVWQSQTLTFIKGTLRFRCATVKWNNSNELEISYHFAYSRSIRKQDNFKIGQSAVITKAGWEYLWTRYRSAVSGGITVAEPQSTYIEQVYPEDDFTLLQL